MGGIFYVYEHWRPDRDECFYVGKGKGIRANDMRRGRNRFHKFIQLKLSSLNLCVEVRMVAGDLSESEAFALEVERIAMWRSDGTDLANLTNGGEGSSGRKHTEEWKRANSERMKRRVLSPETKAKLSASKMGNKHGLGFKKTPEQIEKTASASRGRPKSAETRAKISATKRANPKGHRPSEWHISRISLLNKGRVFSAETREKMSISAKLRRAREAVSRLEAMLDK